MSTFTTEGKNSATFTNEAKSTIGSSVASAGQAMGLLLALTYSGGQVLGASTLPIFTSEGKNAAVLTSQTKN